MSEPDNHPYFDLDMVENNHTSLLTTEMENGFKAIIKVVVERNVPPSSVIHLSVVDEEGTSVLESVTPGNETLIILEWANNEINRAFPRREVLEQAVEYQKRMISYRQGILDAVSSELQES